MTRLATEQAFHDEQAARRRLSLSPAMLRFTDADYLNHESWVGPAFAQLGDVAGLRVLDLGCGHGMAGVVLARRGAIVAGLDASAGYLAEAQLRADANGVSVEWLQGDAERLPFADESFDRVWGHAILHHLDVSCAAAEIRRVLRSGGRAVFCEPWGDNPLLRWARRRAGYASKERTPDEEPLRSDCLPIFQQHFATVTWTGYQLTEMVRRAVGERRWVKGLRAFDRLLLKAAPPLRWWCRYAVLVLDKGRS